MMHLDSHQQPEGKDRVNIHIYEPRNLEKIQIVHVRIGHAFQRLLDFE